MEKKTLRKADLVTSIILMIFAIGGIVLSIQLVLNTLNKDESFFRSAGLFPGIAFIALLLCSLNLFVKARKDGARFDFFTVKNAIAFFKSREFKVAIIIIGLLSLYVIVLLPLLSYMIATFLFLSLFMLYFSEKSKKKIFTILIVAAVSTAVLTYGFGYLAMIPLP